MKWLLVLLIPFSVFAKHRVAIVDSPLIRGYFNPEYLCETGHFGNYLTRSTKQPHGTNIYNLITKNVDKNKVCIVMITMIRAKDFDMDNYYKGLESIKNVKFVNMSLAGTGYDRREATILKRLLDKNVIVLVAAGNDGVNLDIDKRYPASLAFPHPNFVVIGNYAKHSNYGSVVDFVIDGNNKGNFFRLTGTSQSTARATNFLLKRLK